MLCQAMATPQIQRRTQEERRAETRTKILEATIESLDEVGYAATTTRRVAEKAGVSMGAQTHHFPHRVDLVGAAVEHLAERRTAEIRAVAEALPGSPAERLPALLDMLWADFSSSLFTVFVKLWVAAAEDEELYTRLVPVERQLARAIARHAAALAGDLAETPGWEARLMMVLSTLRGLALTERFEPHVRSRPSQWPAVRAALLEAAAA